MIDIEFYGKSKDNKAVVSAWETYKDHLYSAPFADDPNYKTKLEVWLNEKNKLLINLLVEMSNALKYEFSDVDLKRAYTPEAHFDVETELNFIRGSFVELFLGKKSIPIHITDPLPGDGEPPKEDS
jgi:hypothetical protein